MNMKATLLALLLSVFGIAAFSQSNKEVKWTFSAKKIADKTYEVHLTATVNGNWHIYSQNVGVEGPIPTAFTFTKNPILIVDSKPKEVGKVIKKNEEVWGGTVNY
jgi:thiol:disulfide interchange protein DsbD